MRIYWLLALLILLAPGISAASDNFAPPSDGIVTSIQGDLLVVKVSDTLIYKKGYIYLDNAIQSFELGGGTSVGNWIVGSGEVTIPLSNFKGKGHIAVFSCSFDSGWDCYDNMWQMSEFNSDVSNASISMSTNGSSTINTDCQGCDQFEYNENITNELYMTLVHVLGSSYTVHLNTKDPSQSYRMQVEGAVATGLPDIMITSNTKNPSPISSEYPYHIARTFSLKGEGEFTITAENMQSGKNISLVLSLKGNSELEYNHSFTGPDVIGLNQPGTFSLSATNTGDESGIFILWYEDAIGEVLARSERVVLDPGERTSLRAELSFDTCHPQPVEYVVYIEAEDDLGNNIENNIDRRIHYVRINDCEHDEYLKIMTFPQMYIWNSTAAGYPTPYLDIKSYGQILYTYMRKSGSDGVPPEYLDWSEYEKLDTMPDYARPPPPNWEIRLSPYMIIYDRDSPDLIFCKGIGWYQEGAGYPGGCGERTMIAEIIGGPDMSREIFLAHRENPYYFYPTGKYLELKYEKRQEFKRTVSCNSYDENLEYEYKIGRDTCDSYQYPLKDTYRLQFLSDVGMDGVGLINIGGADMTQGFWIEVEYEGVEGSDLPAGEYFMPALFARSYVIFKGSVRQGHPTMGECSDLIIRVKGTNLEKTFPC